VHWGDRARLPLLGVALFGLVILAGGAASVAGSAPRLTASGPTVVSGTDATGVFRVGDRTVRQVRYADDGTLVYTFTVTNEGRLPVTVAGLSAEQPPARLFRYLSLAGPAGARSFRLGAGASAVVRLSLRMVGCETLSARAGSFFSQVVIRTTQAGLFGDDVTLTLPEEVHTGSPREAFCPNSTAGSRPPG